MKLPQLLQVPESVYVGEWSQVTDSTRWAIARQLGLPMCLEVKEMQGPEWIHSRTLSMGAGMETPVPVQLFHPEKFLAQVPITKCISLWRELLPHPFVHAENTSDGLQFKTEDAALIANLANARVEVAKWELSLEQQELSGLVLADETGALEAVIAFQTVRKRRVRTGLLQSTALDWVRSALVETETGVQGFPRMQFFTCGTLKSESSDSKAYPLPESECSSHLPETPIHPENP